jgi:integrase
LSTTKLTGVTIQHLKPSEDGTRVNNFDSGHKGLCLRVGKRDKTWAYHYRFDGKMRSPALGKFVPGRVDHMDRAAAIAKANQIDEQVSDGIDPKVVSKPVKPKPTTKNPNTFKRRVKEYLILYKQTVKPKTYNHAQALLTGEHVSTIEHSDVSKISRSQIVKLLENMDKVPIQANRLHAYLNKFFNWCWDHECCEPSPMVGLNKRFKERARKRNLTTDEVKQLWKACIDLGYPWGDWCQFTLATGQRPGECLKLNRKDVLDGVWLVEGGDPKNDERHRIPLPIIARNIIKNAPKQSEPFVFSITDGDRPISQGGMTYGKLYEAIGLNTPWQPRDLRRTFQTLGSEALDLEPFILGVICNQISVSKPGVAKVYNQAKWMKRKKRELEAWNHWLLEIVSDE